VVLQPYSDLVLHVGQEFDVVLLHVLLIDVGDSNNVCKRLQPFGVSTSDTSIADDANSRPFVGRAAFFGSPNGGEAPRTNARV
jgi:hypothetical protein